MDARLIFEPGLIDLVMRNGTPADFAAMEACCISAEQSKTLEEFERWGAEFHHKIAEAAHNNFMVTHLVNVRRNLFDF
jgi:DNA-binding FadR family transcriptional regulator